MDYGEIGNLLITAIKNQLKKEPEKDILDDILIGSTEIRLCGRITHALFKPEKNLEAIGFKKQFASDIADLIGDFVLRANRKIILIDTDDIGVDYTVTIMKDFRVKVTRTVNIHPAAEEIKITAEAQEYRDHVLKEIEEGHFYPERVRKFLGV